MAGGPKGKALRDLLTQQADSILERIAAGEDVHEMCKQLGIFPAQLAKFYTVVPEFRDRYRTALETAKSLHAEVRNKASRKVARVKGFKTQREIVAMFQEEILDRIREGALIREIAAGYEVDYSEISKHFHSTEELTAAYTKALEEGGHALAEKAVAVTEGVALDLVDAKVMETRSNRYAWLAAKRNKQYDQRQQVDLKGQMTHSVSIDIQA